MPSYLLGIDNGSTMSKAAVFDMRGQEINVACRPVKTSRPHLGWSQRDMNEMWRETAVAIREAIQLSGINPQDIKAIGCTGHGNGIYLLDSDMKPVRPAINSDDSRGRDIAKKWKEEGLHEKVLEKTMQSIWPAQPNVLLRWLKENEPESYQRIQWMLMAKDYTRWKLTGVVSGEITDMTSLSLMDNQTGKFDEDLFRIWGIDEVFHAMPPLIQSTDVPGHITLEASKQTGLAEGTPVCGGAFDIDACSLASGMIDQSQCCMVSGTWGNHLSVTPYPVLSTSIFMCSRFVRDGWYLHLEGSPSSAGNLEWFIKQFLEPEHSHEQDGNNIYDFCNRLYASSEPENSLFFLPFVYGSHTNANATGGLLGIEARHTRGDVIRAIYESVAFSHRWQLDRLLNQTNPSGDVRLTGGVTKNPVWVQLFADTFQKPILIPDGSELGALGAAIIASVAVGVYNSFKEACSSMTQCSRRYEPSKNRRAYLDKKYDRYVQLLQHLQPIWDSH